MRAAVVTIGCKNESLGAFKLAAWLRGRGWDVHRSASPKVCMSYLLDDDPTRGDVRRLCQALGITLTAKEPTNG